MALREFSEYHHWFSIGIALRALPAPSEESGERFARWCLRLNFGHRKAIYIPVWPHRDKRKKESGLWT